MKLIEINWNPSHRQLRQFGLIALFALPLLGLVWSGEPRVVGVLGACGALLCGLGIFKPQAIKAIYLGLCLLAAPIGIVVSELLLLLTFFGVMLPIGLLLRIIGFDPLQRRFLQTASYWQPRKPPARAAQYLQQW